MDAPVKMLTKEEKENVLLVLNEFTEEYKANTKSITLLIATIKECTGRIDVNLEKIASQQTVTESGGVSPLQEPFETSIEKISAAIDRIYFPENEMNQLSVRLDKNLLLLQNPVLQKVVHHHHTSKIIWLSAGLFLFLVAVCAGWYMTSSRLDDYVTGDIKYRYLKQKSNPALLQMLYALDSLQVSGYAIKDSLILWETEEKKAFELSRKLQQKSEEGKELKGELEALKKQNKRRKATQ